MSTAYFQHSGHIRHDQALTDMKTGLLHWRLWQTLAYRDLRRSYYGSFFGPLWITLSLGIFILIVGGMYSLVFSMSLQDYIPFLCSGLVSWRFISQFITEGGTVFLSSGGFIKGFSLPLSVFLYKTVFKSLITFLHYLIVYAIVAFIFSVPFTVYSLLLIPGLIIVSLNGLWVMALLGILCTRYRDLQQLLSSAVVLVFFITPVLWPDSMIQQYREVVTYNPFYHVVEIVRAPLLGKKPDELSWLVSLGIVFMGFILTYPLFAKFRSRIVFWI
ncbi:MAG: ABC transporter permease [Pseudomonadota bacterium]